MSSVIPERIVVSEHAAERWVERVEGRKLEKSGPARRELMREATDSIRTQVVDSIREYRIAKRKPRWACRTDFRPQSSGTLRYAWNETLSICFLVRKDGSGWLVVTLVTEDTK